MQLSPFSSDAAGLANSEVVAAPLTRTALLLTQTLGPILCNSLAIHAGNWHAANLIYAVSLLPTVLLELLPANRSLQPCPTDAAARRVGSTCVSAAVLRFRPPAVHAEPP